MQEKTKNLTHWLMSYYLSVKNNLLTWTSYKLKNHCKQDKVYWLTKYTPSMEKDIHHWSLYIKTIGSKNPGKNPIFSPHSLYLKNNKTLAKIKKKLSSKSGKSNLPQLIPVKRLKSSKSSDKCSVWVLNKPSKLQIKHLLSSKEKEKTKQKRLNKLYKSKVV